MNVPHPVIESIEPVELKINRSLSTCPGQTPNSTVFLEDAECEEERRSRSTESWESAGQLQSSEGASSGPAARDVLDGEEQNGRRDQEVSAAVLEDRVPADIPMIVLSSDKENDPEEQQDQNQGLYFEDEYRLMNQDADDAEDESSEPDEAGGDEALDEELNGNLFFEEVYKRLSGAN